MIGALGSNPFDLDVVVAASLEWDNLVTAAKRAGADEVGEPDGEDYGFVFDERAGVVFVNPNRAEEVIEKLKTAAVQV